MNDTKLKIKLKIGEYYHPMEIERSKEEIYRKAAKLVDTRFAAYKDKYKKVDDNMILSFVALDFALQYLTLEENKSPEVIGSKINELTGELEKFLKNR